MCVFISIAHSFSAISSAVRNNDSEKKSLEIHRCNGNNRKNSIWLHFGGFSTRLHFYLDAQRKNNLKVYMKRIYASFSCNVTLNAFCIATFWDIVMTLCVYDHYKWFSGMLFFKFNFQLFMSASHFLSLYLFFFSSSVSPAIKIMR